MTFPDPNPSNHPPTSRVSGRRRGSGRRVIAIATTICIMAVAIVAATGLARTTQPSTRAALGDIFEPQRSAQAPALPDPTPTTAPTTALTASPAVAATQTITATPTAAPVVATRAPAAVTATPAPKPVKTAPPVTVTAAPVAPPASTGWRAVVNDQFNSGGVPSWWRSYSGPYGSGPQNCAIASHSQVSGGYLHLLMSYEDSSSLPCGPGWYTAGLSLSGRSSVDQRITVRFRVVENGVSGHFIVPMRWPDANSWPAGGEEDYCERSGNGCMTFLHYGSNNSQQYHSYSINTTQWHTVRFQRRNNVVTSFIDNMTTPVWTFTGNSTTLPNTLKHVVLQQECQSSGCPDGTSGGEDIQIDWITVENPA